MARKAIIFGNGLGMALDPQAFSLAQAMHDVWHLNDFLTGAERTLISQTLGDVNAIPQTEEQLDILHQAVGACKTLNRILSPQLHWLTPDGQNFPSAVAKYIQKVAARLHLVDADLPAAFVDPLIQFVMQTKTHVATLNYDRLLYGIFIDRGILSGYDGALVDGIYAAGFTDSNLLRKFGRSFGYYLHLHGSPLFYDDNRVVKKMLRSDLSMYNVNESEHIVLTHVRHKRSVIAASPLLLTYWSYLRFSLREADSIIVFGYSGCDTHLNEIITMHGHNKNITVVEWDGAGSQGSRSIYWSSLFGGCNVNLIQMSNILDFRAW
ncbi:hypothetical protein HBN70_17145 [Pseudomonas lundensis]|uniref:hypothetical protein n=1 Tax=Pseudomonas lundensis TaxID=86185 RepID=UPI0014735F15|nr:hypothetical protein [Pseudomonas lundensis]NNA22469.1 hypothetical protein [Pseudomonas lundensis]